LDNKVSDIIDARSNHDVHWMVVFRQIYIPLDLPRQRLDWMMVGEEPIYMWQCIQIFLSRP